MISATSSASWNPDQTWRRTAASATDSLFIHPPTTPHFGLAGSGRRPPARSPSLRRRADGAQRERRSLAEITQQEVLVLAGLRQLTDVAAQAVVPRRVEEQFHQRLLARLEQFAVDAHRVLVEDIGVLHAVDQEQLAFQVLRQGQQRKLAQVRLA